MMAKTTRMVINMMNSSQVARDFDDRPEKSRGRTAALGLEKPSWATSSPLRSATRMILLQPHTREPTSGLESAEHAPKAWAPCNEQYQNRENSPSRI
jgi:hypothetical protein